MGAQYFILLKGLEVIGRIARVHAQRVRLHARQGSLRLLQGRARGGRRLGGGGQRLLHRRALAVDEVNGIRVNNPVVLAANLKVVCDQIYGAFGHQRMGAPLRSVAEDAAASWLHPRSLASPAGGVGTVVVVRVHASRRGLLLAHVPVLARGPAHAHVVLHLAGALVGLLLLPLMLGVHLLLLVAALVAALAVSLVGLLAAAALATVLARTLARVALPTVVPIVWLLRIHLLLKN